MSVARPRSRFLVPVLLLAPLGSGAPAQAGDILLEDGFESGDTFSWSNQVEEGPTISVIGGSTLEGQFAARFSMSGTSSLRGSWLLSTHPQAETEYRARFLARWTTLALATGSHVAVLRGFANETGPSGRVFELRLHRPASGSIRLLLATSDASEAASLSRPVCVDPLASHLLELRWRTPSMGDRGTLHLLVDGALEAVLNGELLAETTLEVAHFGTTYCPGTNLFLDCPLLFDLPNPFQGASGALDLDAFESFSNLESAPDPIFAHDFDCGDLAGWTAAA